MSVHRRSDPRDDHLATSNQSRWLVTRDMGGVLREAVELPPGTNLLGVMTEAVAHLRAEGYSIDEEPSGRFPFFFAQPPDGNYAERLGFFLQERDPALPAPVGHRQPDNRLLPEPPQG
jgi:hypothetical protein